jgi:DNA transposition AAA+ family ATPase
MIEELSKVLSPARIAQWPEDAAISRERWEGLTVRLIDAMSGGSGLTYETIRRETGVTKDWIDLILTEPSTVLGIRGRMWMGDKTQLESSVEKLEAYLIEFELKRRERGMPRIVETNVTREFDEVADEARELCEAFLFDGVSGIGKSNAADRYIRRVRLAEGFAAPVWKVTLDEYSLNHKSLLDEIGKQAVKRNWRNGDVSTMKNDIRDATAGSGGLLIVDEAQHLGDADQKQGVPILNGLRSFADQGCFGIVLIGNGEIYRKLAGRGDRTQLFSRMERREVFVGGDGEKSLKAGDVRAIADSWGVVGADAYALSWSIAQEPGSLRRLRKIYARARRDFGEISYDTMIASGAQA